MKVVLVPHCMLNQNARAAGAAERPAAVKELVTGLMERGIGIIQMTCPELEILGLNRGHVCIRSELLTTAGRAHCRRIAKGLIHQIEEYRKCGVSVLGILGKNGSPACGVEETWMDGVTPGVGVFIEQLQAELRENQISIRMTGIRDAEPEAALELVDLWLSAPTNA